MVSSDDFQPFWKLLPERLPRRLRGQWRRWKVFPLAQIRNQLESLGGDVGAFDAELQRHIKPAVMLQLPPNASRLKNFTIFMDKRTYNLICHDQTCHLPSLPRVVKFLNT
jgi:hypothetical protein